MIPSNNVWRLTFFIISIMSSAFWADMPHLTWLIIDLVAIVTLLYLKHHCSNWQQVSITYIISALSGIAIVILHGNILLYQKSILFASPYLTTSTIERSVNKLQLSTNQQLKSRKKSKSNKNNLAHSIINLDIIEPIKILNYGFETIAIVNEVNEKKVLPFLKPKVRLISNSILTEDTNITAEVILTPLYGLKNEVGFDLEAYFFANQIMARAIINKKVDPVIKDNYSWRANFITSIKKHTQNLNNKALINALTFSDRSLIEHKLWRELRDSGLIHLVSISGLHIGMAFSFGLLFFGAITMIWGQVRFAASYAGLFCAGIYAWLANFPVPTLRALIVCIIYTIYTQNKILSSSLPTVLFAVALQLSLQPFTFLGSSFWLSYLSVLAVLSALHIVQDSNFSNKFATNSVVVGLMYNFFGKKLLLIIYLQLVLTILIIPISSYFFGGFSISSLFYNLIFIPWFAIAVVPLIFIALFLGVINDFCASMIWKLVDLALEPLVYALNFAHGSWTSIDLNLVYVGLALILLWVSRRLFNVFFSRLLAILIILFFLVQDHKSWRMDVLDIGHGLAILFEKDGKSLLYDTAKSWAGGSVAEQVVAPILQNRGYKQIDSIVISHFDNDHIGGMSFLKKHFDVDKIYSSSLNKKHHSCVAGENWQWQGLNFNALWPPKLVKRPHNYDSCVIQVHDPQSGVKILLTGDITKMAEIELLRNVHSLKSDIVIVPHHGSKTSSNLDFIKAVSPVYAIASMAKGNRWNLPALSVKNAYQQTGAIWLDTADAGQISVNVGQNSWQLKAMRQAYFSPWYRRFLREK